MVLAPLCGQGEAALVEVNPILDRENRTAVMMRELAASLLGKTIL